MSDADGVKVVTCPACGGNASFSSVNNRYSLHCECGMNFENLSAQSMPHFGEIDTAVRRVLAVLHVPNAVKDMSIQLRMVAADCHMATTRFQQPDFVQALYLLAFLTDLDYAVQSVSMVPSLKEMVRLLAAGLFKL
jgi:hypothetical protein